MKKRGRVIYYNTTGYAQFIPQPIFTTVEHGTAVAVGAIGGPAACGASFFIVYDNSLGLRCLAIANSSYDIVSSEVCDSAFAGVTALACLDNACFMLNPIQKTIIVLNNNSSMNLHNYISYHLPHYLFSSLFSFPSLLSSLPSPLISSSSSHLPSTFPSSPPFSPFSFSLSYK